jgi:hypothetical protein
MIIRRENKLLRRFLSETGTLAILGGSADCVHAGCVSAACPDWLVSADSLTATVIVSGGCSDHEDHSGSASGQFVGTFERGSCHSCFAFFEWRRHEMDVAYHIEGAQYYAVIVWEDGNTIFGGDSDPCGSFGGSLAISSPSAFILPGVGRCTGSTATITIS